MIATDAWAGHFLRDQGNFAALLRILSQLFKAAGMKTQHVRKINEINAVC